MAVPVWPNGYLEPLVAACARKALLRATPEVVSRGILRIGSALSLMKVKFVPVAKLSKNPESAFQREHDRGPTISPQNGDALQTGRHSEVMLPLIHLALPLSFALAFQYL